VNSSKIQIGVIVGASGIKGLLKVKIFLVDPKIIKKLGTIMLNSSIKKYKIDFIRKQKNLAIVKLDGIEDRNKVELLINKKIYIDIKQLPILKKNEFYSYQLIGLRVERKNKKKLGIVKNINNFGSDDLIEIETINKKTIFLPINKENVLEIDINNKRIIVEPIKGLLN
tara:strand:+ start:113 stop:619 length:507 start_codon:yes stop_codon:yes gene_type:complete